MNHSAGPLLVGCESILLISICESPGFVSWGPQLPQPRAHILAAGALQIIGVRDFHQIRRPPVQVFQLDEVITLNRFHGRADWKLAREATLASFVYDLCSRPTKAIAALNTA